MKKNYLFCLGLFIAMFSLSGCSDSGSSSSGAVVAPSATVLPFGVETMTLPVDDDETMEIDFTYNNRGQLVEAAVTLELDRDNDGIPDETETTIYALDPDRSPSQLFDPGIRKSIGPVVSLAKAANSPLSYFPGAILEVEYTRTAAAIVEEQIVMTYSYDSMDRLEQVVGVRESLGEQQRRTSSYFYDAAGNLVEIKGVLENMNGNGWVTEDLSETTYTYDGLDHLIREEYSTFNEEESRMIPRHQYNYSNVFDDQGRIETIEKEEINFSDGVESGRSEETHNYTYESSRLVTYRYENSYRLKTYTFSYDPVSGHLSERREVTDNKNEAIDDEADIDRYTYDDEGRLTSIEYIGFELSGEGTFVDLTTFVYDEKGRLTEWIYEDSRNEVVDGRSVARLSYDAAEDSAQGTVELFERDLDSGSLSSLWSREVFTSFAAGAPAATLDVAVETSYFEDFGAYRETNVTVPLPALYGIGYGALMVGI